MIFSTGELNNQKESIKEGYQSLKFFWKMRRDKIEVMAAKQRKAVASCSPVAGSCLSLSSLTVVVTGVFSSFAGELSVTTGAVFSVSLGTTYSGRVTTGGASVTTYDKQLLLKAVLDGDINPGRIFTQSYSLDEIDQAYKDMDERKTIKAMIVID